MRSALCELTNRQTSLRMIAIDKIIIVGRNRERYARIDWRNR